MYLYIILSQEKSLIFYSSRRTKTLETKINILNWSECPLISHHPLLQQRLKSVLWFQNQISVFKKKQKGLWTRRHLIFMGDGIVWYHPCGYLFKKIITSFYTYLCCLLNTFLLLSGLCYSLEIWCICWFIWVSSRIFKSYCWLKLCQSIILIVLWVPKV